MCFTNPCFRGDLFLLKVNSSFHNNIIDMKINKKTSAGHLKINHEIFPEKPLPSKPEKIDLITPDINNDPTKPKPGSIEPGKNDPNRIKEPQINKVLNAKFRSNN